MDAIRHAKINFKFVILIALLALGFSSVQVYAQQQQGSSITVVAPQLNEQTISDIAIKEIARIYNPVQLRPGWNLISAPTPSYDRLDSSSCSLLGPYYHYNPSTKSYETTGKPTMSEGYWVYSTNSCELRFFSFGDMIAIADTYKLGAGWNQIGLPFNANQNINEIEGSCSIISGPYAFDTKANDYYRTDELSRGKGVFVKVSDECSLKLGNMPPVPPLPPQPTNNTTTSGADIAVISLKPIQTQQVNDGRRLVQFEKMYKNMGGRTSSQFSDILYIDDAGQGRGAFNPLEPGQVVTTGHGVYALPGWHTAKVVLSTDGEDTNPSNNEMAKKFYVEPIGVPPSGTISIIAPNGGENWQVGKAYTVGWRTDGLTQYASIYPTISFVDSSGAVLSSFKADKTFVNPDDSRFGRADFTLGDSSMVGKKVQVRVSFEANGAKYSGASNYISITNSGQARACAGTTSLVSEGPLGGSSYGDLGLDVSAHPEILKYRIQWFSGGWSDWYVPGTTDVDWKTNDDGSKRRVWAYFADHNHEYEKCSALIINQPPVIVRKLEGPASLDVLSVGAWKVAASDPEGGVITYTVKFGDGESRDLGTYPSNKEVVIEKKYQSAGSYYITVTAKDDAGKTVESGTNVNVNAPANKPPVIDGVGGDYELKVNQQGTWTVKAHDPDGTQLFYAVIWGDEPSIENAKKSIKVPYSGSEATFQHTYANAGKYTARFFVSDSAGAVVETTYTVKVSQDAKLCQKSANEVRSALGGSEFGDLGLDTSAHPEILKYRIQWFSGGWSDWYTPGQNDIDWKVNNDGSQRRVWGYFADHTHEIVKCIDPKTL